MRNDAVLRSISGEVFFSRKDSGPTENGHRPEAGTRIRKFELNTAGLVSETDRQERGSGWNQSLGQLACTSWNVLAVVPGFQIPVASPQ